MGAIARNWIGRAVVSLLLAFGCVVHASAEAPAGVLDVFRTVVQSLASQDVDQFLSQFDPKMTGYAELRGYVGKLIVVEGAASTIEPVANSGNADHQEMQLDWLLRASGGSRRQIVKCTLDRRGKKWTIVALEPVSFFRLD